MDARELLRRYLEQRREMGERELMLDGMSVEEVMKILGVKSVSRPERSEAPAPVSTDWRSALREAGGAPAAVKGKAGADPSVASLPRDDST